MPHWPNFVTNCLSPFPCPLVQPANQQQACTGYQCRQWEHHLRVWAYCEVDEYCVRVCSAPSVCLIPAPRQFLILFLHYIEEALSVSKQHSVSFESTYHSWTDAHEWMLMSFNRCSWESPPFWLSTVWRHFFHENLFKFIPFLNSGMKEENKFPGSSEILSFACTFLVWIHSDNNLSKMLP